MYLFTPEFPAVQMKEIQKKEKIMNEQITKSSTKKWKNVVKITKHFIERYHERIWGKRTPDKFNFGYLRHRVLMDMDRKMTLSEKYMVLKFGDSSKVKLPFQGVNELVIKNNRLVTILN